ncbi:hypothetical protein GCM10010300_79700 [Streptomyces olivaceoviridis]|uniref:hypothetical protein n=1 Tax=Streptomyces olivaceoviridis TaxID=1921 RepID=UPI00167A269A|nr:hypothetical protein [Streptomyces olivaceoviridis]GGZ24270.1 hypothetical protein GCM10010300_79700 [Streptomyces olivaceoviridis]
MCRPTERLRLPAHITTPSWASPAAFSACTGACWTSPARTFPLGDDVYTTLVVNNCPKWPYPGVQDEEKLLLLEHADSSALTVLRQEGDYAGLQGRRPDGTAWWPAAR